MGTASIWAALHLRSPMVHAWRPGAGSRMRLGPLQVRVLGDGSEVVLLLHGMLGAGSYFGAAYDRLAADATLVVPDLLGFAGSMDAPGPFDEHAHVAALDAVLDALARGRGGRPRQVRVLGHSMGGSLALRWAARTHHEVRQVVTSGAPLYRDPSEADRHIAAMGRFERLLSGDTQSSRRVCDAMCRHRGSAQWLAVASRPDLPVQVARDGVRHTWVSYRGAMVSLVRDQRWPLALAELTRRHVPVTFLTGRADPVPAPAQLATAESERSGLSQVYRHPSADHDLPMSHPGWVLERLG